MYLYFYTEQRLWKETVKFSAEIYVGNLIQYCIENVSEGNQQT